MNVLMTAMQPGGGIRTFFRYIYSQPSFKNDKFTLVAPDSNQQLANFFKSTLGEDKLQVLSSSSEPLGFIKDVRLAVRQNQFDLLHSHGFGAGLLSQIATINLKSPKHLLTAHDVFLSSQFVGWKGHLRKLVMGALFKRMDCIHTVTIDATDNFKEFFPGVPESNLQPILHGVDTEFFANAEPGELRRELGLSENTPIIGFFGRFMGQKGFRTLVDSLSLLKKQSFVDLPKVVTFGWGGFIREDYEYLASLGLSDHFVQMPATDNMPAMIKAVDMVVMPSRWEACGLLGMEVLAAGVPLLSTDCIGLREVIAGSPTKVFAPGDAEALAVAISEEVRSPTKEKFLVYQPAAVKRFHISRPAEELRELYHSLTGC